MLEFREIDRHNFRDILKLSTTESQKFFVATNAYSLSQAYAQPECVPLALYDGDTPVGFTMYGLDVEDTEYWICLLYTSGWCEDGSVSKRFLHSRRLAPPCVYWLSPVQ